LHEELLDASNEKTEQIKQGNMEELTKLLMEERKLIQTIEQLETERQKQVENVFSHFGIETSNQTVSELVTYIENESEKNLLDEVVAALVRVMAELKRVEQLNNSLIQQSMQFVHLSLDMLQPSAQSINYTDKNEKQETVKQSVFDSKA